MKQVQYPYVWHIRETPARGWPVSLPVLCDSCVFRVLGFYQREVFPPSFFLFQAFRCSPMAGLTESYRTIQASSLRTGVVLRNPICDPSGRKLLGAGIHITDSLLDRLREREVYSVVVAESDLEQLRFTAPTATLNQPEPLVTVGAEEESYLAEAARETQLAYAPGALKSLVKRHRNSVGKLQDYLGQLASEKSVGLDLAEGLVGDLHADAAVDGDLCVCLGSTPSADRYPSRHSWQTTLLSMALARTMNLESTSVMELGLGCLLHDAGMLQISPSRYEARRSLNVDEFAEIARHPVLTFELLLDHLDATPAASRMVAYQMHERFNGSGYPRNRSGQQIHQLARIAMVADTYVALVAPRPHRQALVPYAAIEKLLRAVKFGLYDPDVVRAVLHTTSLFPIGSRVALTDGRQGRVVRANGTHYDRPLVEVECREGSELLDLSQTRSVKIAKALPTIT